MIPKSRQSWHIINFRFSSGLILKKFFPLVLQGITPAECSFKQTVISRLEQSRANECRSSHYWTRRAFSFSFSSQRESTVLGTGLTEIQSKLMQEGGLLRNNSNQIAYWKGRKSKLISKCSSQEKTWRKISRMYSLFSFSQLQFFSVGFNKLNSVKGLVRSLRPMIY